MDDTTYNAALGATAELQFDNTTAIVAALRGVGIKAEVYRPDDEFMGYLITNPDGTGTFYVYGPDGPPVFMDDDVADQITAAFDELGVL